MGQIEALITAYARFVSIPWSSNLAGAERVWMVVDPPREERRLRMRVGEFETETWKAGHEWKLEDITDFFPNWLSDNEYRESYFEEPELLGPALDKFATALARTRTEEPNRRRRDGVNSRRAVEYDRCSG